jgi:TusA-related sulfurtransferase
MTTTSRSDTDAPLMPGDAKVYLAQTEGDFIGPSTGFNYTDAHKEAERLEREAELGWYEARAVCDDPEAARDAAEKARAAGDAAEALGYEAHDATWPEWDRLLPEGQEQKPGSSEPDSEEALREFLGVYEHTQKAEDYARSADAVADAIERGEECPDPLLTSRLELPPTMGHTSSLEAPLSLVPPIDAQVYASTDMRNPLSADNPRFLKAYTEIASIDESHGRAPDAASERLAAVATVQSKVDELDSIGRVVMNADATRAFITNT